MRKLFMSLLDELNLHGDVTAATLYKNGDIATITVETEEGECEVMISKKGEEIKNV